MISTNVLSELQRLDRSDKLRVMQFLVAELAKDDGIVLKPGAEYSVWSPYNAFEAAHTLTELLKSDQETIPNG